MYIVFFQLKSPLPGCEVDAETGLASHRLSEETIESTASEAFFGVQPGKTSLSSSFPTRPLIHIHVVIEYIKKCPRLPPFLSKLPYEYA